MHLNNWQSANPIQIIAYVRNDALTARA